MLAFAYSAIIQPLIYFAFPPAGGLQGLLESRIENRIFWPALAALAVALAVQHRSRFARVVWPPNLICLLAYVVFAGASVLWAFKPDVTLVRFIQEVMVLTSIVVPAMLTPRSVDMLRGIFACFVVAAVLNVLLIPGGYATLATYGAVTVEIGYPGYFTGKNLLGEFAALALLMSIHELLYPGLRRALGITVAVLALLLIILSSSKTSLALAIFAPALAALLLLIVKTLRISFTLVLAGLCTAYAILFSFSDVSIGHIGFLLTGDSSLTGRTVIWSFAETEIARSPLLGWGYQCFWLAGPDAPSIVDAPGWVKLMPNAHNGYYDAMLELGYIGLALLIVFLMATLVVIGRVAINDLRRGWLLLSIALFIIFYNFLETLWLRAFDMSWVVFVIVAVEAARQWQPISRPAYGPRPAAAPIALRAPRAAWRPRLGTR